MVWYGGLTAVSPFEGSIKVAPPLSRSGQGREGSYKGGKDFENSSRITFCCKVGRSYLMASPMGRFNSLNMIFFDSIGETLS